MFFGTFAQQAQDVHHLRETNPIAFRAMLEALYDGDVEGRHASACHKTPIDEADF